MSFYAWVYAVVCFSNLTAAAGTAWAFREQIVRFLFRRHRAFTLAGSLAVSIWIGAFAISGTQALTLFVVLRVFPGPLANHADTLTPGYPLYLIFLALSTVSYFGHVVAAHRASVGSTGRAFPIAWAATIVVVSVAASTALYLAMNNP